MSNLAQLRELKTARRSWFAAATKDDNLPIIVAFCLIGLLVTLNVVFRVPDFGIDIGTGTPTSALAASTIDPSAMMMTAKDLPTSHYDDYSLVFVGP